MTIPKIDSKKCAQRNRITARKGEVEAFPIRFRSAGDSRQMADATERAGYLPATMHEALAMIRGLQPEGATPLEENDVFVHVIEAANTNFIGDRYMFLGESTLRNIAAAGPAGVSFMNSHRTGDLSTPSELPFGQSFAGQFEASGEGESRTAHALLGVFLRRGIRPNGANGPSTDDLHAMIEAGALRDVSVGLYGGEKACDVCGNDYMDGEQCSHFAGTTRNMTEDQKELQAARGIPQGRASYTLNNATLGEVSAVFDGAVPSAGVRKILSAGRAAFSAFHLQEAVEAFGPLLNFEPSPTDDADTLPAQLLNTLSAAVERGVTAALAAQPSADPAELNNGEPMDNTTQQADPVTLQAELQALQAAQAASEEAARKQAAEIEQLRAQNERLENERLEQRFTAEVKGHNGGTPWAGDHLRHVAMLTSLARAFGEESEQFAFYTEQNRAHAEQLRASELLKENGRDTRGPVSLQGDADREIEARVAKLRLESPSLSYAQAYDRVLQADPALYGQLRQE